LVIAAAQHLQADVSVPDEGSLREDLARLRRVALPHKGPGETAAAAMVDNVPLPALGVHCP